MSGRKIVARVGALAVAAFLVLGTPAHAIGSRAGNEAPPARASAWQAFAELLQDVLDFVGLRPVWEGEGIGIDPYG
jgi:hypothetical protein